MTVQIPQKMLVIALIAVSVCLSGMCVAGAEKAAPTLPTVAIEGEYLTDWEGTYDLRDASITYTDPTSGLTFSQTITIKPQGRSAMFYEKINFTIKMQEKKVQLQAAWGKHKKYCLKADYIDPTHAGNIVSARLAAQIYKAHGLFMEAPNNGVTDGFPVWVTLNGEAAGLYTLTIPKDAWLFGMDEKNPNHIVLCGREWSDACLFRANTFEAYEDWKFEVGEDSDENIAKFEKLLTFVNEATDADFKAQFETHLDLDACMDYLCFIMVSHAIDNIGKNILMVTYDGQVWSPLLYDLDSLWGFNWTGREVLFGDATDAKAEVMTLLKRNKLLYRVWTTYQQEVKTRYAELRSNALSMANIEKEFAQFTAQIPAEYYAADAAMWNADGKLIRSEETMLQQLATYLPAVDALFEYNAE